MNEMENHDTQKVDYTIREFRDTKDDAELLAECYNSWDNPESWPGGFYHGEEVTAERILEHMETDNPLSKMVVEVTEGIVGYCDVKPHFYEEDTVYVQLIGVSPEYQGLGIGKNLLLHALEKARRFDKKRITLHTWGGNLKAVPLYKKTGYFWAPESSVYMENFLPGILREPLFRNFFNAFGWYATLERSLDLRPDGEQLEGMTIYRYFFKGNERNSLKVLIDQKAKEVCGFELHEDGQRLGATCRVKQHRAYVGYSRTPVIWTFKNKTKRPVRFTLTVETTDHVALEDSPRALYTLDPGEERVVKGRAKLKEHVQSTPKPESPHERTKPRITSHVSINGEEIDLTVGLVPIDPLEVQVVPMKRSIIPGERTTIPIRVWNKTREHLTGLLRISDVSHVNFESKSFPIDLQPNERRTLAVHLQLEHRVRRKENLQLHLHFYKIENGTSVNVSKQTIFIPIIDTPVGKGNACNGYIVEGKKAILENRTNRLEFTLEPPYFLHELIDKRSNERFQVDSLAPDLGLPFEGETGELARKKQHLRLFHKKECTSLVFSSTSQKKKGLEVKREFTLCPDSNFIKVNVSLINHSNQSHDSVGWRYFGEPWGRFVAEGVQYLPLEWGILRVQNRLDFSQEVHFPRNAEKWRESWTCFEFSDNKLFGVLWDPKHVEKVRVRTLDVPSLQYAFETIAPGEKEEVTFYLFLGRGTWRDFRTYWKQIVLHDSSVLVPPEHPEVINELLLTTESSTFGTEQAFNIQPIATSDTLTVVIRNNTLRMLKGELRVQLPEGLSFLDGQRRSKEPFEELSHGSPLERSFQVQASKHSTGTIKKGRVTLRTESSTFDFSVLLEILDEEAPIQIGKESLPSGKEHVQINNGTLSFTASKDHQGSLTSLKVPALSKKNFLQSSWPNVKPFSWYSHWYGGCHRPLLTP